MDARRPEKAEPGLQIGGLVIEAAQGAPGPRIQRTGRNDDRRPPRCMSDHIAAGVRRERKARLGQQVDIMLQPIGYSEVPHRRAEQPCVEREKMRDHALDPLPVRGRILRSEEHTSELQSLMRISYAVFCLKKKTQ